MFDILSYKNIVNILNLYANAMLAMSIFFKYEKQKISFTAFIMFYIMLKYA